MLTSSIFTGKLTVSSRLQLRRTSRRLESRWRRSAALSNCCRAMSKTLSVAGVTLDRVVLMEPSLLAVEVKFRVLRRARYVTISSTRILYHRDRRATRPTAPITRRPPTGRPPRGPARRAEALVDAESGREAGRSEAR